MGLVGSVDHIANCIPNEYGRYDPADTPLPDALIAVESQILFVFLAFVVTILLFTFLVF